MTTRPADGPRGTIGNRAGPSEAVRWRNPRGWLRRSAVLVAVVVLALAGAPPGVARAAGVTATPATATGFTVTGVTAIRVTAIGVAATGDAATEVADTEVAATGVRAEPAPPPPGGGPMTPGSSAGRTPKPGSLAPPGPSGPSDPSDPAGPPDPADPPDPTGSPGSSAAGGGVPAPPRPTGAGLRAPGAAYAWPLHPAPAVTRLFRAPTFRYGRGHRGADLAGGPGQPVLAAREGIVVFAGWVGGRPVVSVDHPDGLRSTYEPVRPAVVAGTPVTAGDPLGVLDPGHPGCPAPACLHWGVRRDRLDHLDPLVLLRPPRMRLLPWTGAPP